MVLRKMWESPNTNEYLQLQNMFTKIWPDYTSNHQIDSVCESHLNLVRFELFL